MVHTQSQTERTESERKYCSVVQIGKMCTHMWYKYSHHGQLQATSVKSLSVELKRDTLQLTSL